MQDFLIREPFLQNSVYYGALQKNVDLFLTNLIKISGSSPCLLSTRKTKIERPVLLLQNTLSNDGCVKRYKNSLIARNVVSELQKEVCHWINSICTTLVECVVWIAYLFQTLTRILAG